MSLFALDMFGSITHALKHLLGCSGARFLTRVGKLEQQWMWPEYVSQSHSLCRSCKHIKISLVLEWRALISIHILVFALKVALQTAKNLSPKKYFQKKPKILGISKWGEKTFRGALSCSFALAVNGGLTQDVQQVRTTAPITHSNYCLTSSDGSSKQADSCLLKGSLHISPTQAASLSAEATEHL